MATRIFSTEQIMAAANEFVGNWGGLLAINLGVSEEEIERRLRDPTARLADLEIRAEWLHVFITFMGLGRGLSLPFTGITSQMSFEELAEHLNSGCSASS